MFHRINDCHVNEINSTQLSECLGLTNYSIHFDFAAEMIKLPFPPPYLNPNTTGKAILQGVNFASGAGGYLRSSGFNFVNASLFDHISANLLILMNVCVCIVTYIHVTDWKSDF